MVSHPPTQKDEGKFGQSLTNVPIRYLYSNNFGRSALVCEFKNPLVPIMCCLSHLSWLWAVTSCWGGLSARKSLWPIFLGGSSAKKLISATIKVRGQQTWLKIINVKHLKKMAVQRAAKHHWLPIYAPTHGGFYLFSTQILGWRWERDASRQVLLKTWDQRKTGASWDQTACRPVPHFLPTLDQRRKMSAQCQSRYMKSRS